MTAGGVASGRYLDRALALHDHLVQRHVRGGALVGPDSGVRVNYRLGRFVKSYLRALPWRDDLYYLQAQGYWSIANDQLAEIGRDDAAGLAAACCDEVLRRQHPDGSWPYPNREWAGRVATAEGTWAALGLLSAHRRRGDEPALAGALAWAEFLDARIGYVATADGEGVNYFAGWTGSLIPNNSAMVARFLAELAMARGDGDLGRAPRLVRFLRAVQLPGGELPYEVDVASRPRRRHFQCFQYAAFQCLDLAGYHRLTGDRRALEVVSGLAMFLRSGLGPDGRPRYDCGGDPRAVVYHAAAIGAALVVASRLRVIDALASAELALDWALARQRPDGSLPFSLGDHGLLDDVRSYPRNEAMVLHHLLTVAVDDP